MGPRIKRLESKDALIAVHVVKSFAAKDVSVEYMERFLSNPMNYLILATVNDDAAGFLLAYALERLKENSHKLFIYEIEVAENYRRQGVGAALIDYVREIVRREKMINAFVFTNYSNIGAVEFYKSTGAEIANGDDLLFVYTG
jgi:ribosomal protein S18 acetylase RimI-like enzyme